MQKILFPMDRDEFENKYSKRCYFVLGRNIRCYHVLDELFIDLSMNPRRAFLIPEEVLQHKKLPFEVHATHGNFKIDIILEKFLLYRKQQTPIQLFGDIHYSYSEFEMSFDDLRCYEILGLWLPFKFKPGIIENQDCPVVVIEANNFTEKTPIEAGIKLSEKTQRFRVFRDSIEASIITPGDQPIVFEPRPVVPEPQHDLQQEASDQNETEVPEPKATDQNRTNDSEPEASVVNEHNAPEPEASDQNEEEISEPEANDQNEANDSEPEASDQNEEEISEPEANDQNEANDSEPEASDRNAEEVPEPEVSNSNEEEVPEPEASNRNAEEVPEPEVSNSNEEEISEPEASVVNEHNVPEPEVSDQNETEVPEPKANDQNETNDSGPEATDPNEEEISEPEASDPNEEEVPEPEANDRNAEEVPKPEANDRNAEDVPESETNIANEQNALEQDRTQTSKQEVNNQIEGEVLEREANDKINFVENFFLCILAFLACHSKKIIAIGLFITLSAAIFAGLTFGHMPALAHIAAWLLSSGMPALIVGAVISSVIFVLTVYCMSKTCSNDHDYNFGNARQYREEQIPSEQIINSRQPEKS